MIEIKNIVWENERMTLPRSAGRTALHAMSLLDGELCHTEAEAEDGPSFPKIKIESVVGALLAMPKVTEMVNDWFDALQGLPLDKLTVPTGHPKYFEDDNDLIILGIGKKQGALAAFSRSIDAVKMVYERYCEVPDSALPDELSNETTATVFACLGIYFIDLLVEDRFQFNGYHLVHACECLAIASLNRAGDEALSISSSKRRAAASLRWKRDPTQRVKAEIRRKWESWWIRKELKYKNDEDFGRSMHKDFPEYESERSIANLSRKWKREIA